jgi:hypothetical protein
MGHINLPHVLMLSRGCAAGLHERLLLRIPGRRGEITPPGEK